MVRKRAYKKHQIVSDESDSDDFYEESTTDEPQQKKYSLRQRRGANFAEDFDYDLVEEENLGAATDILKTDDADFDVKEEIHEEGIITTQPRSNTSSKRTNHKTKEYVNIPNCTITKCKERELEPEIPKDKQSSDDMIDFEDVIRADILVNKSRIDYDSIIEKSEIKLETKTVVETKGKEKSKKPLVKPAKLNKNGEPPKKRGRKSKKTEIEDDDYEAFNQEPDNTGLPINSVLGVTESLYELAERYHLQGGSITEDMQHIIEPESKENITEDNTGSDFIKDGNTDGLQETETASEAIETF